VVDLDITEVLRADRSAILLHDLVGEAAQDQVISFVGVLCELPSVVAYASAPWLLIHRRDDNRQTIADQELSTLRQCPLTHPLDAERIRGTHVSLVALLIYRLLAPEGLMCRQPVSW
jgi:hypothetical protein